MRCRRTGPRSPPRCTSPKITASGLPRCTAVMRLIVRRNRRARSRRRRPADAFHADGGGAKVLAQPRKSRHDRLDEVRHRLEESDAMRHVMIDAMHDRARAQDELSEGGHLAPVNTVAENDKARHDAGVMFG